MGFFDTVDFIDEFAKGGCFIFEGEEGDAPTPPDTDKENPQDPPENEAATDTPPTEDNGADGQTPTPPDNNSPDQAEPPQQTPTDLKQNTADTVNSEDQSKGTMFVNADTIAQQFIKSGALQKTVQYAVGKLTGRGPSATQPQAKTESVAMPKITLSMIQPYIKAAVEKFCQMSTFRTNVAEMAKAIMELTKSLGVSHVEKEKAKAAKAQQIADKKQDESKPSEGGAPAGTEAPADQGGEPSGGDAPTDTPPPSEGGEESTPEPPQS